MQEEWKAVEGYEFYEISNMGRLRVIEHVVSVKGRQKQKTIYGHLKSPVDVHGYLYYTLYKDGIEARLAAHRMVAQAFIPNPLGKPEVNHIDADKHNNRADNLEWVTRKENEEHKASMGLQGTYDRSGDNNPMYGRHHSDSAKEKIAAVHRGTKHSDSTRAKMSAARKGKSFSEEHKQNLSLSLSKAKQGLAWVHKEGKTKQVKIPELDSYLADGWERGRKQK